MNFMKVMMLIILLPISLIGMSEEDKRELKFEREYLNAVSSDLLSKQQILTWTGSAGLGYGLVRSVQSKKTGALAGLSIMALSGAGFAYLEHQLQNNNTERTKIAKKLQQLTDK